MTQGPDGKFRSIDEMAEMFDDLEYLHYEELINSADNTTDATSQSLYGEATEFEGVEILDFDRIVDRHEVAHLLWTSLSFDAEIIGEDDGPANLRAALEVSADPALQVVTELDTTNAFDDQEGVTVVSEQSTDDTADLVVPPVELRASAYFTDETNNTGGGGDNATDDVQGPVPGSWDFDRRDELYLNGVMEYHSVGDPDVAHVAVNGSFVFGITED